MKIADQLRAWTDLIERGYEVPAAGRTLRETVAALEAAEKALERCLRFIQNTESEIGDTLESGDAARAALTKLKGE